MNLNRICSFIRKIMGSVKDYGVKMCGSESKGRLLLAFRRPLEELLMAFVAPSATSLRCSLLT